jgi:hypothetical protein
MWSELIQIIADKKMEEMSAGATQGYLRNDPEGALDKSPDLSIESNSKVTL